MGIVVINGREYCSAKEVAELWGLKLRTVKAYATPSSGKLRGCVHQGGELFVPVDTIRPITKPVAQGLIWALIKIKNDSSYFVDLSQYGIRDSQIGAVLDELSHQMYIDLVGRCDSVREKMLHCRITERAFQLIEYKKQYKDNLFQCSTSTGWLELSFGAVQTVMQPIELIGGKG